MPEYSTRLHNFYSIKKNRRASRNIFFIITEDSVILILENTATVSWVLIINILKIT